MIAGRWFPVVALFAAAAAVAAPALQEVALPAGVGQGGDLDDCVLLDASIARGWAAIEVVSRLVADPEDGIPGSVDCHYAGLSATPTSGVSLATWDLNAGQPGAEWIVDAMAADPAQCTSEAVSTANLADAKAAIAARGLDIARKPALIAPVKGRFALRIGGKAVKIAATTEVFGADDDPMLASSYSELSIAGAPFYRMVSAPYSRVGAAGYHVLFVGAYVEGDKAFFVQRTAYADARTPPRWRYSLSPVFDLAS